MALESDERRRLKQILAEFSILEVTELVSELEEKWGVSAADAVAESVAIRGAEDRATRSNWSVKLLSYGTNKVGTIKVVRAITGLGLKEAKDLVESLPRVLKENITEDEAEDIVKQIRESGAAPDVSYSDPENRDALNDLSNLEESQWDALVIRSLGIDPTIVPATRVVPINLYLADGTNSDRILAALEEFLSEFELEIAREAPAVISSFFKRLWARTTNKETLKELEQKLQKVEEALETQQIDKPKSEIDLNHATAVEKLLVALGSESKSTALHVGNLLVLSMVDDNGERHDRVLTLTKDQIALIQGNQSLLRKPELLYQRLNQNLETLPKRDAL